MAQHTNGFGSFCEAHERRLAKAEEQLTEYHASIETTGLELKFLKDEVKTGFESLSSKMELIGESVQVLAPRLQVLEANKRIRDRRFRGLRSGAIGLFMAGAGGLAVKLGEHLWVLLYGQ